MAMQPPESAAPLVPAAPLAAAPLTSAPPLALQLLLAQAVCQLGTDATWPKISQMVESSQEWPDNAAKMTQQGYESAFKDMMGSRGLDASACATPQARPVRKLIHSLYSDLLVSLREHILSSHAQESKLKGEIAQIASGQIDNRLFESAPQAVKDRILESEQARNQEKEEVEKGQAQPDPLEAPERANAEPPGPQLEKPEDADEQENHDVKGEAPASLVKTGDKEPVSDQVAGDDPANAAEANNSTATVTATLDSVDTEQDSGEGKDEDLEDEAEAEEEEKSPKKRSRATTAARKGSRTTKRKASEPTPPAADSPASIEPESAAPASKRAKRGARKSRGDTEAEQEARDPPETKESKQMAVRRRTAYTRIIETIRTSLPFSSSFDSKVTKSQAPNYSAAVQRPTCLRDIAKKIKNGEIKDNSELMREFAIMCANAVQFNGVEGEVSVGRQAQELWEAFEREMNETLSTEFLMDNSG